MRYQLTIDDYIGDWGYSKRYVRQVLAGYAGKHVDVKISSLGGDLNHALDIRKQFLDHGDVTVHLSGFVASAATVIAMGAKRIIIGKYTMYLVHKCSNFVDAWGSYNADEMAALIEKLTENKQENDKIDVMLATMYAEKCNKKVAEILDVLKRGAWLTAQEAYDMGFVDEIADEDSGVKLNCSADTLAKFAAIGLPLDGLKLSQQPVDEPTNNNKPMNKKTFDFEAAGALLNQADITPDNDGYVSVTAEDFEKLSGKLDELQTTVTQNAATIAERDAKIAELTEQVENLKKQPADDTPDIKDDGAADEKVNSKSLYDSVKDLI